MFIVWRGAGIIVPILIVITGWIVGIWFEDNSFGNKLYMGWTFFYSGILLSVLGGLMALPGEEDQPKTRHHFMWLPVWLWGVGMLGLSIYWIWFTDHPEENPSEDNIAVVDSSPEDQPILKRGLHFCNTSKDSLRYRTTSDAGEKKTGFVAPGDRAFVKREPGNYLIEVFDRNRNLVMRYPTSDADVQSADYTEVDGKNGKVIMRHIGPGTAEELDWDEAFVMMDANTDLALVDISVMYQGFKKDTIKTIDWLPYVHKTYNGKGMIEPLYNVDPEGKNIRIFGPTLETPAKKKEKDVVYLLVPYPHGTKITSKIIADHIIEKW